MWRREGNVDDGGANDDDGREGDNDDDDNGADDVAAAVGVTVPLPLALPAALALPLAEDLCFLLGLSPCLTASATGYSHPPNRASSNAQLWANSSLAYPSYCSCR